MTTADPDQLEPVDCRSPEGITEATVDMAITAIRHLARRDLTPHNVQNALADFFQDPELQAVRDAWKAS